MAEETAQSVKTMVSMGKGTDHRGNTLATLASLLLSPATLLLYSTTDHSEHNWLSVSSMLGSKHQITKICELAEPRLAQDRFCWLLASEVGPAPSANHMACKARGVANP